MLLTSVALCLRYTLAAWASVTTAQKNVKRKSGRIQLPMNVRLPAEFDAAALKICGVSPQLTPLPMSL